MVELKPAFTSTLTELKTIAPASTLRATISSNEPHAAAHPFIRRIGKWKDVEYRQGYLEASIEQGIAWQIRANRKARNLTQAQLANMMETNQSAVSRLEDPEYGAQSLDTLVKVAHIFDCALSVKFIPYSKLAEESADLTNEALTADSFESELNKIYGVSHG